MNGIRKGRKEKMIKIRRGGKENFECDYLNLPPLAAGKHTVTPDSLLAITWANIYHTDLNISKYPEQAFITCLNISK